MARPHHSFLASLAGRSQKPPPPHPFLSLRLGHSLSYALPGQYPKLHPLCPGLQMSQSFDLQPSDAAAELPASLSPPSPKRQTTLPGPPNQLAVTIASLCTLPPSTSNTAHRLATSLFPALSELALSNKVLAYGPKTSKVTNCLR